MGNVLIIGYGHMGKRYGNYLKSFGYGWNYFDPYVKGGEANLNNINQYTHIIISTPPEQHYSCYKTLNKFKGSILIDKPVVVDKRDLSIFEDERVFYSLTERYNPAAQKIKELVNTNKIRSIEFIRNSNVNALYWDIPILFDLGIHDLDLYFYITDESTLPKIKMNLNIEKTHFLNVISDKNYLVKFMWSHECTKIERKIKVHQEDTVIVADLIDQTVTKYENDNKIVKVGLLKEQPIRASLIHFLNAPPIDRESYKLAHSFMTTLINKPL